MDILTGKRPPLEDVFVNVAGSPSLGASDAKVTVVEFTDFQCAFCAAYAHGTFERIIKEYVQTGKVRYVVRNFPLEQSHPLARKAAEAGLCAHEQGKFWALHDRFFADQKKLAPSDLPDHVSAIGADLASINVCLESGKYGDRLAADLADGRDLRVVGTPTFFIGYADQSDPSRIRAVRSIGGDVPYSKLPESDRRGAGGVPAERMGAGEVMSPVPRSLARTTTRRSRYLPTSVVASRLGVSARTVRLWAECGEIPAVKIGRQWRIEETELERWLSRRFQVSNI